MMQTFFKAAILDKVGLTEGFFSPVKLIELLFSIQVKEAKCCSCVCRLTGVEFIHRICSYTHLLINMAAMEKVYS